MRAPLLLATSVAASILTGCSGQPTVKYEVAHNGPNYPGDFEGLTKFTLPKSVLYASYSDPDKKTGLSLASTPAEAGANGEPSKVSFMIRPSDSMGIKTHLMVKKRDNTDLLESVGTEIEDNRTKMIESVAGIAVSVIGIAALAAPPSGDGGCIPMPAELPLAIDTEEFLNATKTKAADPKARHGSIQRTCVDPVRFDIQFGSLPGDAIARETFIAQIKDPQEIMIYSACRTATITFTSAPLAGKQFTTTVADPNFIQTIKFPQKGKVDMHSACGANTSSEKSGISSSTEVMNTLIAQAKTVREAWKTKKEADDKK